MHFPKSDSYVTVVDGAPQAIARCRDLLEGARLVVDSFGSAEQFLRDLDSCRADCLIVEVDLPGMSGFELQDALRARGRCFPVIFVNGTADIPMAVEAIKRGAEEFLLKPVSQHRLIAAVQTAIADGREERRLNEQRSRLKARLSDLTPREREVLELICQGRSPKQVATGLSISVQTVSRHCISIREKIGVDNHAQLVRLICQHSILPCSEQFQDLQQ